MLHHKGSYALAPTDEQFLRAHHVLARNVAVAVYNAGPAVAVRRSLADFLSMSLPRLPMLAESRLVRHGVQSRRPLGGAQAIDQTQPRLSRRRLQPSCTKAQGAARPHGKSHEVPLPQWRPADAEYPQLAEVLYQALQKMASPASPRSTDERGSCWRRHVRGIDCCTRSARLACRGRVQGCNAADERSQPGGQPLAPTMQY